MGAGGGEEVQKINWKRGKNHQKIRRHDKLASGKTSKWKYWKETEIFLKVIIFIEKKTTGFTFIL